MPAITFYRIVQFSLGRLLAGLRVLTLVHTSRSDIQRDPKKQISPKSSYYMLLTKYLLSFAQCMQISNFELSFELCLQCCTHFSRKSFTKFTWSSRVSILGPQNCELLRQVLALSLRFMSLEERHGDLGGLLIFLHRLYKPWNVLGFVWGKQVGVNTISCSQSAR